MNHYSHQINHHMQFVSPSLHIESIKHPGEDLNCWQGAQDFLFKAHMSHGNAYMSLHITRKQVLSCLTRGGFMNVLPCYMKLQGGKLFFAPRNSDSGEVSQTTGVFFFTIPRITLFWISLWMCECKFLCIRILQSFF